jgi:hypothetical protein
MNPEEQEKDAHVKKSAGSDRALLPILPAPPDPPTFRTCPACSAWFALRLVHSEQHDLMGRIEVYRCRKCGEEFEFAEHHPPGAV